MTSSDSHPARRMWGGALRILLAESLLLPTGLVTAVYLTRRLGPESYGLLTLAAVVVGWVEWGITSVFSRATIKLASQARDWRPIGALALRAHLVASTVGAAMIWLLADPIAALLREDVLAGYLRLFALDIPLFSLAYAHRDLLVARGKYRERALGSAGRWVSKLVIILVLVELGFSVPGAIAGSIGASVVELAINRYSIRPSLLGPVSGEMRQAFDYALPLFLFALAMQLYDRLDVVLLKVLGGTAEQAGWFGAAQNLSIVPGLFALSLSPLLLSTLTRLRREGRSGQATSIVSNALRVAVALFPFAALAAGSSPELIALLFGPAFEPVGPLFRILVFGAGGLVLISVATAILTAAGKPGWTFALTGPLVPLAAVAHLLVIPSFGAQGAALVTTTGALVGALATLLAVKVIWGVAPPASTVVRSLLIGAGVYAAAVVWPTPGFWVVGKLLVLAVGIPIAYVLLRELRPVERAWVRVRLGRG